MVVSRVSNIIILSIVFFTFFSTSCTNKCTEPVDYGYPEKLYPYEIIYDAETYKQRRDALINQVAENSIF